MFSQKLHRQSTNISLTYLNNFIHLEKKKLKKSLLIVPIIHYYIVPNTNRSIQKDNK